MNATRESIERFGFVNPITVRPHPNDPARFEIINGEHRWRVAVEREAKTIPAIVLDVSDAEARKLTIVLDQHGEADEFRLGQLLAELSGQDDFLVALAFPQNELERLLKLGTDDWDELAAAPPAPLPPPPPAAMHEVVLSYDDQHNDQFQAWVKIVEKENGLTGQGVSAIVYDSVRRVAHAANQGT